MPNEPSSVEEAVELFLALQKRGSPADPREFAARHAQLGPDLPEALSALAALDDARALPDDDFAVPARVGAYRVLREIGRGGMGLVLEAIEEPLGRRVALKILPAHSLTSSSARARFRREAEIAARLDHPCIATLYGTGVEDERPWIAMRFVEGATLASSIAEARESGASSLRLSGAAAASGSTPLEIAACLAKVARALQAAHEHGVVHRDVKPSNIIVAHDGTPVLVDFGLAIHEESSTEALTRTGETAGTPAYLAPEVVGGELQRPDAQSDVYALGVTLYECLALRRPFDAPTPAALYRSILSSAPTDVRAPNRSVPRDLAVVVATAMERDRARRYASAAALAADLEACCAQRPIAARPLSFAGRVLRWGRREPRQAALAGLLLLATIGMALFGGTWWASRPQVLAAERLTNARAVDDAVEQGYGAIDLGHLTQADTSFVHALALDPASVEAGVGRVLVSSWRKQEVDARERLAALPAGVHGREALEALVSGKSLPLNAPIEPDADSLELFVRGQILSLQSMRLPFSERRPWQQRALAHFTEAVLRAPAARPIFHEQRAGTAQQVGDEKAARSAAAALQQLWPESAHALYAAGRALYAFEPARARTLLERSVAIDPSSIDTYNLLVQACLQGGDVQGAESWCWRALARYPDSAPLNFLLGSTLTLQGCGAEGRVAHLRAATCDPALHVAWSEMAAIDFILGDLDIAVDGYARALQGDPGNHRVRLFLGALLDRRGERAQSVAELDYAIAGLYPADAGFWTGFASAFLRMGASGAALRMAETGLTLAPTDPALLQLRESAQPR